MPTQPGGYRCADGKRVPSVTTITGRFKEADGLIYWASRLALEPALQARSLLKAALGGLNGDGTSYAAWERDCKAFLELDPDSWDHKQARDKAADAGTVAHEMVDDFIHGRAFDATKYKPELIILALPAYEAFRQWADQSKLEVIETEKPLVSEKYRFGGTRDAIGVNGKRAMMDWKTSNSIYPEYLCQLAAYGILDEEAGNSVDGGYHLVRFSKQAKSDDPVQFSHHYWSHLDGPRRAFLLMRELYEAMGQIRGLAK